MGENGKAYEDSLLAAGGAPAPGLAVPPPAAALGQIFSYIPSAWFLMTAKLGIADLLKDGPMTAAKLAAKAGGVREDNLYRALRMLTAHGLYEALPGADGQPIRFRNNAISATLRADHPQTVKSFAIHAYTFTMDSYLPGPVEWHLRQPGPDDGPCAFERAHDGQTWWERLRARPADEELFSKAMNDLDALGLEAILSGFDWRGFKRVVDVAGANGSVLAALLQRFPGLQGVLFDQPQVIEGAKQTWQAKPAWKAASDRVAMVGGDFFKPETLPELRDGDVCFLRYIIHDWSDEASVRILKALRQAIGGAKVTLVLCEMALEPEFSQSPAHTFRYVLDVHMLNALRGKERTTEQFQSLFDASGFRLKQVHQLHSPESLVEASPV